MTKDSIEHLLTLKNPKEILELSNRLSLEDLKTLFQTLEKKEEEFKDLILPIILGLQPSHFAALSSSLLIQKRIKLESLQSKIDSLLSHFRWVKDQYEKECALLNTCINELPLYPVQANLLSSLCEQIIKLSEKTTAISHALDHLLKLAWLSDRTEIIDAYSTLKNQFTHLFTQLEIQPTNLLIRLNSIFSLTNETSSIEGLNALGINYLEDLKVLASLLDKGNDQISRNNLLAAVHDRLNAAGLATIEDLKKHRIFTKEHLFAYLEKSD